MDIDGPGCDFDRAGWEFDGTGCDVDETGRLVDGAGCDCDELVRVQEGVKVGVNGGRVWLNQSIMKRFILTLIVTLSLITLAVAQHYIGQTKEYIIQRSAENYNVLRTDSEWIELQTKDGKSKALFFMNNNVCLWWAMDLFEDQKDQMLGDLTKKKFKKKADIYIQAPNDHNTNYLLKFLTQRFTNGKMNIAIMNASIDGVAGKWCMVVTEED